MTVLCLGALLAGLIAASVIPFLPFACALLIAILIGATWTVIGGGAFGHTAWLAFALLFACQIGYGLGVVGIGAVGRRIARGRLGGREQVSTSARPFRTGNRPR